MYEVFLTQKVVGEKEWREFFARLIKIHKQGEKVQVAINFEDKIVRIFAKSPRNLPHFLAGAEQFVLTENKDEVDKNVISGVKLLHFAKDENVMNIKEKLEAAGRELKEVQFSLLKLGKSYVLKTRLVIFENGLFKIVPISNATAILNLDFRKNFLLKKPPKYLNLAKSLKLISSDRAGAVMKINSYPYFNGEHYLNLKNYDFHKHTAVFGASGSGKTKFLSSLISEISKNYGDKYHILMIDPHDAVRGEIGGLENVKVYDFLAKERGLELFLASEKDIVNGVEMTLGLFKSLTAEVWNARLERLLRASLYLLMEKGELSFGNLRRLLTDPAYKNACLKQVEEYLPESLQEFFGQDFNEIRTQHYDATFAVILSLIDELQLTPAFYRSSENRLNYELLNNKVTLVSLNLATLGEKAVKTLAGLVMNQLFSLGVQRKLDTHVIMIVDEVAVVENPVLTRFLAEARKYNISVILAGQYFSQVSEDLQTAIFANAVNYFCFRLNFADAEKMSDYLSLELSRSSQADRAELAKSTFLNSSDSGFSYERAKLLAELADREVVARVSRQGILNTAVMGRSLDFLPVPEAGFLCEMETPQNVNEEVFGQVPKNVFKMSKSNIFDLMREQSTSRRKL